MNQSSVSARAPVALGAGSIALIEGAARDLEDFSGEIMTLGHWPSWMHQAAAGGPMIAAIYARKSNEGRIG